MNKLALSQNTANEASSSRSPPRVASFQSFPKLLSNQILMTPKSSKFGNNK
jgi:hypothetical protein